MQRLISSHLAVGHRLTTSWLGKVERAGFPAVEIFCARQHFDYRDSLQVADLGHWFRDSELKLHSLHSPMFTDEVWGRSGPDTHVNITERGKVERLHWVDEIKRALEVAETIPFKYLIQHLGVTGQEFSEYSIDAAFNSLEELQNFARQRGVEILLENTPNDLSTAERLELFNNMTHLRLNYCFDTGHAHLGTGVQHEFEIMSSHIRSTHVHGNDGKEDSHLFPLAEGDTVAWPDTMKLLKSRPGQYPLMLELRDYGTHSNPLDEAKRASEQLLEI
ncbi:MAG: sugar phosphate isomerase/epimerase [Acidobacteriia bacterium]|nr:sugar phosphate isomerase/epimerase [Terriglobia bacterium]